MKRTKEKAPKLTKEQRAEMKTERKKLFRAELAEGAHIIYNKRWNLLAWASCYLFLALVSLFFTYWTISYPSDFPEVTSNIIPRVFSLGLLTLWGFCTKFRKAAFSVGATVWFIWLMIVSGIPYGLSVIIGCVGAAVTAVFVRYEIIKGYGRKPSKPVISCVNWFYLYTGLTMIVEVIHRIDFNVSFLNIHAPFVSLIENPDIFAMNFMVILFAGLFVFICPRKKSAFSIYSFLWIALSFISLLKYNNVYEPALLLDIFQIPDALQALTKYYSPVIIVLVIVAVVAVVALLVFLCTREKKTRVNPFSYIVVAAMIVPLVFSFFWVRKLSYMEGQDKFIRVNYFTYGFPFSFVNYALKSQVSEPEGYSQFNIDTIMSTIEEEYETPEDKKEVQNVIVLQLESFCDPYLFVNQYPDLEFEEDPIPFLRSLMEEYSTGTVNVPVFGGQTVKSEFEFLTGISLDNLPSGTNPYVSYLYPEHSIDNLSRYFEDEGYATTAIHNYQGEFFTRNVVYKNLGFDTYIPYECMSGVEKKEGIIWADDQTLVDYIERVLTSTDGKDFVFGVTVQLHGNYFPIDESEYTMEIKGIDDKEFEGTLAYYVSQLQAFDKALENLVKMLGEREESTYLLMYSDHLPKLFYDVDSMTDAEKYTTQYFTWNNIGLEKSDANYELSQLSSLRLCKDLSIDGTIVNKFHNVYYGREDYESARELIDYHLYTKEIDKPEYANGEYKIGLYPLTLSSVELVKDNTGQTGDGGVVGNKYILRGSELTENTILVVNGKTYDLEYENANTVYLDMGTDLLKTGDALSLRIIGERSGTVYSESVKKIYNAETGTLADEGAYTG